jgi:hypothetical protein
MKKYLVILLSGFCLCACGPSRNDPKKVASAFLHAYYSNNYENAIRYADPETYADLSQTLEQLQADGVTEADMKAAVRPVIIEIEGIIANDGELAVCAYKLKNAPDDHNAMTETLLLNHTEEGWKVSF